MKIHILIIFSVFILTSCSVHQFQIRKNFHPRVSVEVDRSTIPGRSENHYVKAAGTDTVKTKTRNELKPKTGESMFTRIMDEMADRFVPEKKELLKPVLHPGKYSLTKGTSTDDKRLTGLILNVLAITFAVAALLMIIGVAHGNVWIYFTIGMVLAAVAIILGFIGKHMAWKGLGIIALILGIIAAVGLLIFMLLVVVVHITF